MNTIEDYKQKVSTLIELFERNKEFYKSKGYKEEQLRQQFLNPFFKALGWDMDNEQGFAPQYCEVIHEDRIEIHGKPKAPDYSFRIGGVRKFFVEAKASSVNLEHDFSPAFQLRRYAWSGKLPISILTDFEDFVVYDCTIEPKQSDKTSTARIKIINFKDYLNEAEYIYNTFSKDAILKGSFDKFAKAEKKGNQLVDKSFLNEIETWRNLLAVDIAKSNSEIDIYELNESVQRLIDRIIFLRIAEDRGIEEYETLKKTIESPNTHKQLLGLFKKAHDKYNSNLFDISETSLGAKLNISDKVLDRIIGSLYYPKSAFEFSVIGVEILGSVYEQFLGKVIRLTKGHNAVVEEKPEVKKAGGVYYTPQYIVDYIVKNTVGELVKGKTPKEVAKLKICDPAMGSGSFLLGAYSFLLDWYLDYYTKNSPEKLKNEVFKDGEGNYILSTNEKKRILLNNIYGVDIDAQAVEVTKLSLALKMLENENKNTLSAQMKLFQDRILPDLSSNIKCGNSLIGSDYYTDKNISLLGDEEIRKVNAFDWDKQFPQVFMQGGFDAVIGNPPYLEFKQLDILSKSEIEKKYSTALGKYDIYIVFIEQGIKLLKSNGIISYITPCTFIKRDFGNNIRKFIHANSSIQEIVYFTDFQIFGNVTVFPSIFKLVKNKSQEDINILYFPHNNKLNHKLLDNLLVQRKSNEFLDVYTIKPNDFFNESTWNIENPIYLKIKNKITKNTKLLGSITEYIFQGIASGKDEVFYINEETLRSNDIEREIVHRILKGKDIKTYENNWSGHYVIYPYDTKTNKVFDETRLANTFPKAYQYFLRNKKLLSGRPYFEKSSKLWYELWNERIIKKFTDNKIVVSEIAPDNRFYLDTEGYFTNTKIFGIKLIKEFIPYEKAILGLLNSKLMNFFHKLISVPKAGGFYEYKTQFLSEYPINMGFISKSQEIICFVDKILTLKKQAIHNNQNKNKIIHEQIQSYKKNIDELVYEIYNLTKEEIKIIENQN